MTKYFFIWVIVWVLIAILVSAFGYGDALGGVAVAALISLIFMIKMLAENWSGTVTEVKTEEVYTPTMMVVQLIKLNMPTSLLATEKQKKFKTWATKLVTNWKSYVVKLLLGLFASFLIIFSWFYFAPSAIIVPHHNIVAINRQNFLQKVRLLRPYTKKIILISPDHFSTNQKLISYTDVSWNLSNGKIIYDHSFDSSYLIANNQLLKNDHGIYNIMPDIKKYFGDVTIVPILIGQKLSQNELDNLYQKINNYCSWDCLFVASIDFSHYLPASMADAHDSFTLDSIYTKNLNKIFSSEVDSPQSLYLVSKFAFNKNNNFNLFDHTNSGYMTKNPDIETTTHLFGLFNRIPSFLKNIVKTKLDLPYQIDQSKNLNSLGIRFFYGFDEVNYNSSLPNFAIITTESHNKIIQSYFPLIKTSDTVNFIRGDEKANLIKQYFDSTNDLNITKDYFWGTLTYDRKN